MRLIRKQEKIGVKKPDDHGGHNMERSKVGKPLGAVTALVLILTLLLSSFACPINSKAAESYRSWRQMDSRWSGIMLGTESYASLGGSGCLVTSLAMLAVHTGLRNEESFNPGVFANQLKKADAFNRWGGISSWAKISQVIPEMSVVWAPEKYSYYWGTTDKNIKLNMLKSFMMEGYWPLVNVNTHHWVMVEGIVGDKVYMIDPATDNTDMFGYYGNITRTDTNDFDYILVKSKTKPDVSGFTPPVVYEPSVTVNIDKLPSTLSFEKDQPIDISDGVASVTVVDRYKGESKLSPEPMNGKSKSFAVYTEYYYPFSDMNKPYVPGEPSFDEPGTYQIILEAYVNSYVYTTTTFDVKITGEVTGTPIEPEEYYYAGYGDGKVMTSPLDDGETVAVMDRGDVVKIVARYRNYGKFLSGDRYLWVDLDNMSYIYDYYDDEYEAGDISRNGVIDNIDLDLLVRFIMSNKEKPEGVSAFCEKEAALADVNGDGKTDSSDITAMIGLICKETE